MWLSCSRTRRATTSWRPARRTRSASSVTPPFDGPESSCAGPDRGPRRRGRREDGDNAVAVDPRYYRPAEVDFLLGDATKARTVLAWTPKVGFDALVEMMVAADMEKARKEAVAR